MQSFFICFSTDMRFLQKYKVDFFVVKLFIHDESFFSITRHSTDRIKDNGIAGSDLAHESVKFFTSLKFSSGVYFFDDFSLRICSKNISDLSVYALLWCTDSTVTKIFVHCYAFLV